VEAIQIPLVFSMALSKYNPLRGNDGFLAFGGLAPVITVGLWGVTPIDTIAIDGAWRCFLPTDCSAISPKGLSRSLHVLIPC
jgi:hypothetical protein